MTNIERAPLVSCDVCARREEKRFESGQWRIPLKWGRVNVPPVHWSTYPDTINFPDVCPDCIEEIHAAVSATVDSIHKAKVTP